VVLVRFVGLLASNPLSPAEAKASPIRLRLIGTIPEAGGELLLGSTMKAWDDEHTELVGVLGGGVLCDDSKSSAMAVVKPEKGEGEDETGAGMEGREPSVVGRRDGVGELSMGI
jgi:hypothetical protein